MRCLGVTLPDTRVDFQLNLLFLQIGLFLDRPLGVDDAFATCLTQISEDRVDKHQDRRNHLITYMARLSDAFLETGAIDSVRHDQIRLAAMNRPIDAQRVPGFLTSRFPVLS